MRACASGLSLANGISTPMRRICPDCCACKASGQAPAEPPTSVMKSRRLIAFSEAKDKQSYRFTSAAMHKITVKYQAHVGFGSKGVIAGLRTQICLAHEIAPRGNGQSSSVMFISKRADVCFWSHK